MHWASLQKWLEFTAFILWCHCCSAVRCQQQGVSWHTEESGWLHHLIFSKNRPLGRFFHRVAMSVYVCISLSVPFSCYCPRGAKEVPGEQSQSASSKSTSICCNFLMKTCVAKPVGLLGSPLFDLFFVSDCSFWRLWPGNVSNFKSF